MKIIHSKSELVTASWATKENIGVNWKGETHMQL